MYRIALMMLLAAGLLGGCTQPTTMEMMEPPQKPSPPPEMSKLDRFIGSWEGTAEMIFPKMETESGEPELYKGGGTYEWDMGGMFLKGIGWHEMGPDQRAEMIEYWTWDPKAKKFRTWVAGDWGEYGSGTAWVSADGNTIFFEGKMRDAGGNVKKGKGEMTFVDNNTFNWTWAEQGPFGKMKFKGTSTRK